MLTASLLCHFTTRPGENDILSNVKMSSSTCKPLNELICLAMSSSPVIVTYLSMSLSTAVNRYILYPNMTLWSIHDHDTAEASRLLQQDCRMNQVNSSSQYARRQQAADTSFRQLTTSIAALSCLCIKNWQYFARRFLC